MLPFFQILQKTQRQTNQQKLDFEIISKLLRSELNRFDQEKVIDFTSGVTQFLNSLLETQVEIIALWESYFAEVESRKEILPVKSSLLTDSKEVL